MEAQIINQFWSALIIVLMILGFLYAFYSMIRLDDVGATKKDDRYWGWSAATSLIVGMIFFGFALSGADTVTSNRNNLEHNYNFEFVDSTQPIPNVVGDAKRALVLLNDVDEYATCEITIDNTEHYVVVCNGEERLIRESQR